LIDELLSWLSLLLLAQWFFGNLYEAVALAPNLLPIIVMKGRGAEPLFKKKNASPVAYYVPVNALAFPLLAVLTVRGILERVRGVSYLTYACALLLIGIGLTIFLVRSISLPLFFQPQSDMARAKQLLTRWKRFNYVRLFLAGGSLMMVLLWTRITLQK
jgi:hypothetical protein